MLSPGPASSKGMRSQGTHWPRPEQTCRAAAPALQEFSVAVDGGWPGST